MISEIVSKPAYRTIHGGLATGKKLQQAIDQDQLSNVLKILKNGDLANQPLPNGQMPLNYAIRRKKIKLIPTLFQKVKDPSIKDAQGLTALDHTLIGQDKKITEYALGQIIGASVDGALTKPLSFQQQVVLQNFINDVELSRSWDFFIPKLHDAARKGDLSEIKKLLNPDNPNPYNAYGITPLQQAVLAGKKEVVEWFIEQQGKEIVHIQTQNGQSLLHLASLGGHADLVTYFLETLKLDPNATDAKGKRPLHYALTLEDLSSAKALIRGGANPLLASYPQGTEPVLTPLEVMFAVAKKRSQLRDPLALTNSQVLMFASIIGSWAARLFGNYELNAFGTAAQFIRWNGTGSTTTPRLMFGLLGGIYACHTYNVAKETIQGLGNCWKNRSLEIFRPIRNAIVHSVIGSDIAETTYKVVQFGLQANRFMNAWDKHMIIEEETFRDLELNAKDKFIESFYVNYAKKFTENSHQNNSSSSFNSNICDGKTEEDCILFLNPDDEKQAKKILNFSNETECKKAYYKLNLKYHPDRNNSNSNSEILQKIQQSAKKLGCM